MMRLAVAGAAGLEVVLDDLDEVRLILRREDLAGLGAGAQRHDHLRRAPSRDRKSPSGRRCFLRFGHLGLGLVVDLHVRLDPLLKLERRGALRVDAGLRVGSRRGGRRTDWRLRGRLIVGCTAASSRRLGAVGLDPQPTSNKTATAASDAERSFVMAVPSLQGLCHYGYRPQIMRRIARPVWAVTCPV